MRATAPATVDADKHRIPPDRAVKVDRSRLRDHATAVELQ